MKTKITNLAALILLPAALLTFTSCSSTPKQPDETMTSLPEGMHGGVALDTQSATATVQSVNATDRTVVLQHPDGSTTTYECGPEVRNFDQIKVGDHVTATVAESLAIGLMKGGGIPLGTGTATAVVRAPAGAKPGGKLVDTVGFTAKVISVDTVNRTVTLQTADNPNETVKVGPDINLANVNPGDDVGVRLTRAFAIQVTSPEK